MPTVQGIQGNIQQAFHPAEAEADAAGERSGKKLALAAGAAIAASAAVIGVGLKKAFDLGGVFDDITDTIRVGTGATGAALDGLNDVAKKVGSTIPVEFDKVGSTVADLNTRMGLTGDSLQTVASQFLQAGKILGQDVDINSATAAFTAFGVQGDQVSTAMDNLFRVSQATGVGMNELTSAAKAQAPVLQELGFGFEDTVALVGSLDKAGLNATAVTASLGKGLVKLAKDGEQPQEAFQRITGEISDLVSQGQSAQAIDLAAGIFGTRGATQFVGAVQSGTLNMQDLLAATGATTDTILGLGEETADAAESWQLFKNKAMLALEPIGTAVFNLAGAGMAKLVDGLDVVTTKINDDVLPAGKQMWNVLASGDFQGGGPLAEDSPIVDFLLTLRETVMSAIGPIVDTFGQVFQAIGPPLMEAFKTIWDAVKPLIPTFLDLFQAFNPVGLLFKAILPILPQIADVLGDLAKVLAQGIAKALQAVAPLFQKIVDVINRLLPFVTQLVASLLPPFVALIDKLAPLLDAVLDALVPVVDALVDALIPAIDALMPVVERVFTFIADTIGNIVTVIGGVIDFITGIFTGDWEKVWTGVKEIFGGIWDQIKNIFGTLWDVLVGFFTNLGPALWEIVTGLAGQLVQWGGQFLGWIWQGIQDLWNGTIWPWFQALPGMAWDGIKAAAGWLAERGKDFLQWVWDGITAKFEEVKAWFLAVPDALWTFIQSAWSAAIGWGTSLINWIWTGDASGSGQGGIVGAAKGVFDWFLHLPENIWSAIQGAWSAAEAWGAQLVKYIIEGISGSDPYVTAALAKTMINAAEAIAPGLGELIGLTGVDVDKNIDDYLTKLTRQAATRAPDYNYGGRGGVPGRAAGGLFGPYRGHAGGLIGVGTHGTADDVLIRGSRNEFMVNADATARHLPLLEFINDGGTVPGFADGGFLGGIGRYIGGSLVKAILPGITDALTKGVASSGVASNGQWGPGTSDGTLAANAAAAKAFITQRWGITNIGGVYGGSVPGSDHPIGKALDVMIANYLSTAGIAQGTSVADWFIGNPNAFGTKYVIWRDRINQGGTWAPYQHPSGSNDTLQHRDHVHLSFLTGSGQFTGQSAPAGDDNPARSGFLGSLVDALVGTIKPKFSAGGSISYSGSAGVEQWRSTVLQALGITGQSPSWADAVLKQMNSESSGNPNAINLWDSNAAKGIPSKGLMQVIDPTFRSYALPGYNSNIYDPLSNIIASIRYVLGTYPEGLARFNRAQAYDTGGWLMPGGQGVNLLNRPEAVLTPAQSDAYVTHARAVADGFAGRVPEITVNVSIDGEQLDARAELIVDGVVQETRQLFATAGGQSWPS